MSYNFIYGNIPNEWKIEKLENVTTFISRGRQPKYVEHSNIRTLNQKAIQWFEIKEEHYKYHNEEKEIPEKYFIKYNDIVLNSTGTGTVGRCYHFDYQPENLFADSHVTIIRTNENVLNPRFLMYQLSTKSYQEFILSGFITGSTGQVEFNKSKVQQLPILLPSIEEQNRIVDLVYSFDKKIENNKKMNFILEEMAQAIFKHWFVDFEFPNENGEPYKSSGGKFVESELGMIPEGWKVEKLEEIVSKANTGADAIRRAPIVDYDTGIKCARVGDLSNNRDISDWGFCNITEEDFEIFKLIKGDILVTRTATIGLIKYIFEDSKAVFNNGLIRLRIKDNIDSLFVYQMLNTKDFKNYISRITGETSTRPNMKINYLLNYNFILPPTEIIDSFIKLIYPIINLQNINNKEIDELANLRNTLLPKLISGEIRIPEAEEAVESCLQKSN